MRKLKRNLAMYQAEAVRNAREEDAAMTSFCVDLPVIIVDAHTGKKECHRYRQIVRFDYNMMQCFLQHQEIVMKLKPVFLNSSNDWIKNTDNDGKGAKAEHE